jgi:predicted nucleic acid-binding protein
MNFAAIGAGSSVFLDANVLVYHFTNEPNYGAACTDLMRRIEQGQINGFVSAHVLSDTAHRLMTVEAMQLNGWRQAALASRLRKHHTEIARLTLHRQSIAAIAKLRLQVLPITQSLIESATGLSVQHELLMGDALIVAVMQAHGLVHLASRDADFDRVPGITRYEPA